MTAPGGSGRGAGPVEAERRDADRRPTGSGGELRRKLIHLALSLVAAAVVYALPHPAGAVVLASATAVALAVELLRQSSPGFGTWFDRTLGPMLRPRERHRLTGATTLAVGYTVAAVAVPGPAAVVGILLTGVADAVAAVVGKRFGRLRYPGGKSVEGSGAFAVVAFGLVWGLAGMPLGGAAAVAGVVALLEAPTLPVDDNLYLPLVGAGVLRVAAAWMGVGIFS